MHKFIAKHSERALNVGLRLASLVSKLALTLYMGRYLSLADMGVYGLVFGAVMTGACLIGIRMDFVAARELVGVEPRDAVRLIRDQIVFYGINYLFALAVALIVYLSGALSGSITFFIVTITVIESLAGTTYINMNSMGQQTYANLLFFARSGLWALIIMGLGLAHAGFRNVNAILSAWIAGDVICLAATAWLWRALPWRQAWHSPVDWQWIKNSIRKCVLIWLGALGLTVGGYIDRIIVNHYLGIEQVGIATFYFSFTNSLLTLIQTGVLSFAYPKMVSLHRQKDFKGFHGEVRQATWHVAIFAGFIALGIGAGVPLLGQLLHKQELVNQTFTLWLVLAAVWIRSNAETLYYVLFARHQDKAIWLGNLLFLIPAFGSNVLLVPLWGLRGIGYGAIIAASSLFLWRWIYTRRYVYQPRTSSGLVPQAALENDA